jgi:hypothetical protein
MKESESSPPDDPVYSRKVLEMLTVANEYCLFVEKAMEYTREEILSFLQKISPLIYLKASLLPEISPSDEEAAEHYVTEEQWEDIFNTLRNKFGAADIYYFVDITEKSHSDPVRGSLAENFADLYQDMKDFILLYQKPVRSFKENAVRDLRQLFEMRFGAKLGYAMAALHATIFGGPGFDPDDQHYVN